MILDSHGNPIVFHRMCFVLQCPRIGGKTPEPADAVTHAVGDTRIDVNQFETDAESKAEPK